MANLDNLFSTKNIPVSNFLTFSQVLQDYLKEAELLKPYISTFCKIDFIAKQIESRKHFSFREALVQVLKNQNEGFKVHVNQSKQIDLLKKDTTFCVTTAHQTNLFGGPLYFIQKAISAIKVCQLAKENYPNFDFVPVYWLGTEDHDFEELNHTSIYQNKIEWNDEQGGAFGRYSTESLKPLLQQIDTIFELSENEVYVKKLLKTAYQDCKDIASATRYLLHELLGQYGLVVIDGDDETLKRKMIPVFEKELLENFSYKESSKAIQFLEKEYGHSQAHPREINLFYLTNHSRKRIIKDGIDFKIYGTNQRFSQAELLQELKEHPTRFSPNVILRPLMQEMCLPNLMYVGGGGELSYWFQLKPVFDAVGCPYPMLGFRDTAVYLPAKTQKKMEQLQLTLEDFKKTSKELTDYIVLRDTKQQLELKSVEDLLQQVNEQFEQHALDVDFTLKASALATQQKMKNVVTNFEKKLFRAEKKKHQITIQRMNAVFDTIYPSGKLQERYENFSQYYAQYGANWIDWMLENFNLFTQTVKVLKEKE